MEHPRSPRRGDRRLPRGWARTAIAVAAGGLFATAGLLGLAAASGASIPANSSAASYLPPGRPAAGGWVLPAGSHAVLPRTALAFTDSPATVTLPAPAPAPLPDNRFTFEVTDALGLPARWNACETIHYAVVGIGAPIGWQTDVSGDIAQVAAGTGLTFVDDGTFTAVSQAPTTTKITISWAPAASLAGGDDDLGLTTYYFYDDIAGYTPQMVGAKIQLASGTTAGGGLDGEGPVLLHELGHAVGLGHTPDAPEVMNPYDQGYARYQNGDLNGLAALGVRAGCAGFRR